MDATRFEIVEITNAAQLNWAEPFKYGNITLKIENVQSRAGTVAGRAQEGIIFGGVVARVLD
jgi:hypothetical protein